MKWFILQSFSKMLNLQFAENREKVKKIESIALKYRLIEKTFELWLFSFCYIGILR